MKDLNLRFESQSLKCYRYTNLLKFGQESGPRTHGLSRPKRAIYQLILLPEIYTIKKPLGFDLRGLWLLRKGSLTTFPNNIERLTKSVVAAAVAV